MGLAGETQPEHRRLPLPVFPAGTTVCKKTGGQSSEFIGSNGTGHKLNNRIQPASDIAARGKIHRSYKQHHTRYAEK